MLVVVAEVNNRGADRARGKHRHQHDPLHLRAPNLFFELETNPPVYSTSSSRSEISLSTYRVGVRPSYGPQRRRHEQSADGREEKDERAEDLRLEDARDAAARLPLCAEAALEPGEPSRHVTHR